jgi:hypothetical protein
MEGVNSEMILGKMQDGQKQVMDKESLLKWIEQKYVPALNDEFGDVLITAGAGDIDALVEPIRKIVNSKSDGPRLTLAEKIIKNNYRHRSDGDRQTGKQNGQR